MILRMNCTAPCAAVQVTTLAKPAECTCPIVTVVVPEA